VGNDSPRSPPYLIHGFGSWPRGHGRRPRPWRELTDPRRSISRVATPERRRAPGRRLSCRPHGCKGVPAFRYAPGCHCPLPRTAAAGSPGESTKEKAAPGSRGGSVPVKPPRPAGGTRLVRIKNTRRREDEQPERNPHGPLHQW